MGFYAPAQLIRDARAHRVEVRPVDVQSSEYDCSLERDEQAEPALRLGLRMVKSLSEAGGHRVADARCHALFRSVQDLTQRAELDRRDIEALAAAGALAHLTGNRHVAYWQVAATEHPLPLAPASLTPSELLEGHPLLPLPTEGQTIVADYQSTGLSLGRHPMAVLREQLDEARSWTAARLTTATNGARVRLAGIVITRQRPGSANGVTFVTIEDETAARTSSSGKTSASVTAARW